MNTVVAVGRRLSLFCLGEVELQFVICELRGFGQRRLARWRFGGAVEALNTEDEAYPSHSVNVRKNESLSPMMEAQYQQVRRYDGPR